MPQCRDADRVARHTYALRASGYTVLRGEFSAEQVAELAECADRAIATAQSVVEAGGKLEHFAGSRYYQGARCLYCWGEPCVSLLDHESVHALAAEMMGYYQLWDLGALSALPTPAEHESIGWHRDFGDSVALGSSRPGHLWFFVCLDDVTAENGATWVVPGSHHFPLSRQPACSPKNLDAFPSRVQPCAGAGDIIVLDPMAIHSVGHNRSLRPRRLLNIGICHKDIAPIVDHWAISAPLHAAFSPRVRKLMGEDRKMLDQSWSALPAGWQTRQDSCVIS
ncbi:MAG TPA: phytanoyl-CoA dioxygenase family protein [Planctomycetota bacterium]|nr:phytanoyl-CoA dioxygenase family protein [Planctomycetota bacterium]